MKKKLVHFFGLRLNCIKNQFALPSWKFNFLWPTRPQDQLGCQACYKALKAFKNYTCHRSDQKLI